LADFQFTQVYTGLLFLPPDVLYYMLDWFSTVRLWWYQRRELSGVFGSRDWKLPCHCWFVCWYRMSHGL